VAETIALIDAENVRRSRWPNLSSKELLSRALDWANREGVRAWLIFDGRTPDGGTGEQEFEAGHKAVGTGGETADDWIIRKAGEFRSQNQPYWLITSDRLLRDLAGGGASRVVGGGSFLRKLGVEAKPS
jgi:predicted RNA-binding protein with PIN domain